MTSKAFAAGIAGILVTAATVVAYVATDDEPEAAPPGLTATPVVHDAGPAVFNLSWNGYYKLGLADCAFVACPAHTYETEPFVEALAKAGVRVEIPEGTSLLEFELRWEGDEELHLMIHGPMRSDHSMPSYMGMGGAGGRICLSILQTEIAPGTWEVMAHAGSPGVQDTAFSILVNGEGSTPAELQAGPHGHPVQEDWSMEMRQAQACR